MCTLRIIPDILDTKVYTMCAGFVLVNIMLILTYYLKSPDIAQDLEELASHVDELRCKTGLPTGSPAEWSNEMSQPLSIPPPAALTSGPDSPPICSIDYVKFSNMSGRELQDIFREYPVIVVHGRPTRLHCDISSLEDWGDLDALRVMHGLSNVIVLRSWTLTPGIR